MLMLVHFYDGRVGIHLRKPVHPSKMPIVTDYTSVNSRALILM